MTCIDNKRKVLALALAVMMMISVFAISVFATESTAEVTAEATAEVTAEVTTEATAEATAEVTTEATAEATAEATQGTASESGTTSTEDKEENESTWFEKNADLVITLAIIVGVAVVVLIVYLASPKFREKFSKFWRDFSAEFKKLVWPTKSQLWRNCAVVFSAIVIGAVLLFLLDLGFTKGMYALKDLIEYIMPAN